MESTEEVLAKYKEAKKNKENNNLMSKLQEAYKYCCPRRYDQNSDVEKEIYDSTATFAVQSRVASNHDALFPAFREWIGEEPVSAIDESEKLYIEKQIKLRLNNAHKAVELSNFHIEIEDTLTDTMFSDGAILVFPGTPENPLHFQAVNWFDFYTLNDMDGQPTNNFLKRKLSLKEIRYMWPKATLENYDSENKSEKIEIIDCYTYDEVKKIYTYSVIAGDKRLYEEEKKSSPWVVFCQRRKAIGKAGWGPVLDTMPVIKTTDKIQELVLRNAAIAVAGIWQADDDGVINFDNISLTPGAVIPKAVGSNGLQPLTPKIGFDVSQFVLSDQKEIIKKALQGSALPSFSDGVRTAQEYQLRDAELKKTEIPVMLQLAQGSKRLMKRIFDILESQEMMTSNMYCKKIKKADGKEVQTTYTSPLIRMKDKLEMSTNIQVLTMALQLFGQAAYDVLMQDEFLRDFYIKNGFDPLKLRDGERIEQYREENRQRSIELAQAGVKETRPAPNNISISGNI